MRYANFQAAAFGAAMLMAGAALCKAGQAFRLIRKKAAAAEKASEAAFTNNDMGQALAKAEDAFRLNGDDSKVRAQYVKMILAGARDRLLPGMLHAQIDPVSGAVRKAGHLSELAGALKEARRALALRVEGFKNAQDAGREFRQDWIPYYEADRLLLDFAQMREFEDDPAVKAESAAFRKEYWDFLLQVRERALGGMKDGTLDESPIFALDFNRFFNSLNYSAESAKDYVNAAMPLVEQGWDYARSHPEKGARAAQLAEQYLQLASLETVPVKWGVKDYGEMEKAQVKAFAEKLAGDSDPAVAVAGSMAKKALSPADAAADENADFERLKGMLKTALDNGGSRSSSGSDRESIYRKWSELISQTKFKDQKEQGAAFAELAQTMIDRKEMGGRILAEIVQPVGHFDGQQELMIADLIAIDKMARDGEGTLLEGTRAAVVTAVQQLALAIKNRPESTKVLFAANDPVVRRLDYKGGAPARAVVDGDQVELVTTARAAQTVNVGLMRIAVDGSGSEKKATVTVPLSGTDVSEYVSDASVGNGVVYAATPGGVAVLPLDGSDGTLIDKDAGLPADQAGSVAYLDGKLYVGHANGGGGGKKTLAYLVRYDLKTRQCEVLAASEGQKGRSLLEDQGDFGVEFLTADPERHRVLAFVGYGGARVNRGKSGFYEVAAQGNEIKKVAGVDTVYHPTACMKPYKGTMYFGGFSFLLSYDLATDKVGVVADSSQEGTMHVNADTTGIDAPFHGYMGLRWPYYFMGDALWSGSPLARVPVDTKMPELAVNVKVDGGGRGMMEAVNDHRMLLCCPRGLWMIESGK